jgi:hypothetical protein
MIVYGVSRQAEAHNGAEVTEKIIRGRFTHFYSCGNKAEKMVFEAYACLTYYISSAEEA